MAVVSVLAIDGQYVTVDMGCDDPFCYGIRGLQFALYSMVYPIPPAALYSIHASDNRLIPLPVIDCSISASSAMRSLYDSSGPI